MLSDTLQDSMSTCMWIFLTREYFVLCSIKIGHMVLEEKIISVFFYFTVISSWIGTIAISIQLIDRLLKTVPVVLDKKLNMCQQTDNR